MSQLKKLFIIDDDKKKRGDQDWRIDVLFNPTDYTIDDSNTWSDQLRNKQLPELHFTGGERKKLTTEFFFDTLERDEDVRKYTRKIANLLAVDEKEKRPPICTIHWGEEGSDQAAEFDLPFKCVLESLKQQFTFFKSDGTPVRAKLGVTFKQYQLPQNELKRKVTRKSFPAKTYTVVAGDTLSIIAGKLWKDPAQWRRIAEANNIDDPKKLEPGTVLIIPAVKD